MARSFTPGDRIRPLGMRGHRKVKDIFIDEKLPLARRAKVPIVYLKDEILWVGGLRQSEACKVRESTTRTLKLEISGRINK